MTAQRPLPLFPYNNGSGYIDQFDLIEFASAWNVWAEEWNAKNAPSTIIAHGRRILVERDTTPPPAL